MIKSLVKKVLNMDLDFTAVTEVRVRVGLPITIERKGSLERLKNNGVVMLGTKEIIDLFISKITDNSFYSCEHKFSKGYLDYFGAKIAISGSGIYKEGALYSMKEVTSMNIRIPRAVIGCSKEISDIAFSEGLRSVLIIGKTGSGKTTVLRDLVKGVVGVNTVVVDERGELDLGENSLGDFTDIMKDIDKVTAINYAIRGLNPSLIALDELFQPIEMNSIKKAKRSGIELFATFHGESVESYLESELYLPKLFDYCVVLKGEKEKGVINKIVGMQK